MPHFAFLIFPKMPPPNFLEIFFVNPLRTAKTAHKYMDVEPSSGAQEAHQ